MKIVYIGAILGIMMSCSNLNGIDIKDASALRTIDAITINFEVINSNKDLPLYLFNINNPLVEKEENIVHLHFTMIDNTKSLVLREVPFRSKTKKIASNDKYEFEFELNSEKQFENLGLTKIIAVSDIAQLEMLVIHMGYSFEPIYFLDNETIEKEVTGGEVVKVITDEGMRDIRDFTHEELSKIDSKDLVTLLYIQENIVFEINIGE